MLARLNPEEGSRVLRSLLERHPELVAEAEEIARVTVTDVEADSVAVSVQQAVLDLDIEDLGPRVGREGCKQA